MVENEKINKQAVNELPYYEYSRYLKEKYGEKVYKIPASLPVTCPNRDGTVGVGGCTYCGDIGAGYENKLANQELRTQLLAHKEHIQKKYKATKFIPYFQNYSNTFISADLLVSALEEAIFPEVVEIALSTRPDCVDDEIVAVLDSFQKKHDIPIVVELGLQTVNYRTLNKINRGHGLGEFIDTVLKLERIGIDVCAHVILNLPGDERIDILECAKFVSAFPAIKYVKLHALYIVKNTVMAKEYEAGNLKLSSSLEYMERTILFLESIRPDIVVQRIIGRAPAEHTLTANWDTGWWKIRDDIIDMMREKESYQGISFNYLNGSARRKKSFEK